MSRLVGEKTRQRQTKRRSHGQTSGETGRETSKEKRRQRQTKPQLQQTSSHERKKGDVRIYMMRIDEVTRGVHSEGDLVHPLVHPRSDTFVQLV